MNILPAATAVTADEEAPQSSTEIFPFPVSGRSSFANGSACNLDALGGLPHSAGTVSVATSTKSVTFTVTSSDYFDQPGSTIKFETFERAGVLFLRNTGKSTGLKPVYVPARPLFYAGAYFQWAEQASRFRSKLKSLL